MEDLKKRLIEKSIEAFIMGLEIYNKPTIIYRIDVFSFFNGVQQKDAYDHKKPVDAPLGHSRQQAKAGGIECEKRTDDQQHIRNTPAANLNFGFHSCSPFSKHTVRAGHTARLHRVSIYGRLSLSGPFPGKTARRRGEGGWRSGWLPFPRSAPWQRAENCGSFPGFHR